MIDEKFSEKPSRSTDKNKKLFHPQVIASKISPPILVNSRKINNKDERIKQHSASFIFSAFTMAKVNQELFVKINQDNDRFNYIKYSEEAQPKSSTKKSEDEAINLKAFQRIS